MIKVHKEGLKSFLSKSLLDTPDKQTIIQLRWIAILVSCCLLLFARKTLLHPEVLYAFCLVYVFSNLLLYSLSANRFTSFRVFATLVIIDTVALSASLILTGQLGSDLYYSYFLIILIAGFWKDLRWSLAFALLISSLYTFLLFMADDLGPDTYLRVPFLFIASVFYGYLAQLASTEHQRREKAEIAARIDFLTNLPNRKALDEKLKIEVERAVRYGRPLSLLVIDLDNFKSVNDSLGHQWGDNVLQGIAGILKHNIRSPDFVARLGGEEFAVVLPETELSGAVQVGNRLRSNVMEHAFETPKGLLVITVSVGATSNAPSESADWERLYADADQALYMAKHGGKNQVAVLSEKILKEQDFLGAH